LSERPVLDYEPKPAPPTWRQRVGLIAAAITSALAAPILVLALGRFVIDPVDRHWMAGYEFNGCLDVAWVCSVAGLIAALLAIRYGRPNTGGIMLLLHLSGFLLLPSLAYA
jgi:hypothetical protein